MIEELKSQLHDDIAQMRLSITFWAAQPDQGVIGFSPSAYCEGLRASLAESEAALAALESPDA